MAIKLRSARCCTAFQFDDTTYDKPIGNLSGGERSRLALAKLLLEHHDLIILDEPTNHLDIDTLTWLEGYLKTYSGAILTVSHDQYFLDHVVTELYELTPSKSIHYKTNYSGYLKQKADNLALAWKAYEKQQEEIHKLQDFVDKNIVRASFHKASPSAAQTTGENGRPRQTSRPRENGPLPLHPRNHQRQ
jgi:ATP-binding cassette subfamily F protein 3